MGVKVCLMRHPEEARSAVSKDGRKYSAEQHPSRLAEDGEHLRMTARIGSHATWV